MPPKMLTVFDVARSLGVSEGTIYSAIHKGDLEVIRIGRSIRVTETCLNLWLEKLTQDPPPIPAGASVGDLPADALLPDPPVLPAPALPEGSALASPKREAPAPDFVLPRIDLIVSRHAGIVAWLHRHGVQAPVAQDPVRRSDCVGRVLIGSLPLELAMHASRVFVVRIPPGSLKAWAEMTADDLDYQGAFLVEVIISVSPGLYPGKGRG